MKTAFNGTIVIMALFGLNALANINGIAAWCYAALIVVTGCGTIAAAVRKHNEEMDRHYD